MKTANLLEVFHGIQGEGLWVGVPQIFVRFSGCNLRCHFCDTPTHEVEECEFVLSNKVKKVRNPISVALLCEEIGKIKFIHSLSLTGGEPLLNVDFLLEFLPEVKRRGHKVYLETNGTLPKNLSHLIDWIDIISMDLKLPSFTKCPPLWGKHHEFLLIASKRKTFVKCVITKETKIDEIERATSLIKRINPKIPLVLQPCSGDGISPPFPIMFELQLKALSTIPNVRLIPQVNKLIGGR